MFVSRRALTALAITVALLFTVAFRSVNHRANTIVPVPTPITTTIALAALPSATARPTATPQPTATLARRTFLDIPAQKIAPTTFLPGRGPELPGELVFSGRRLDFYVGRNSFTAEQVAELGAKSEWVLNYVQRRFAVHLTRRVSVGVYPQAAAPGRGTRGIAHTSDRFIRIFYNPNEDMGKALVILSHELGHQLEAEAYGVPAQQRADLVLLEGLATWISGEYWLTMVDAPNFQVRARELIEAGYGGNLLTVHHGTDPDIAYELWAGFVDYLARTYGWDRFNALYVSGRGRAPGSADYMGIYGKSFQELASEWKATLK